MKEDKFFTVQGSILSFIAALALIVLAVTQFAMAQQPPPGYRLQETIKLPVDGSVVTTVNKYYGYSTIYKLRASGTATLGPGGILGDAEYGISGLFVEDYCNNKPSDADLGIQINNGRSSWGPYSQSHVYTQVLYGSGRLSLKYSDCNYSDNSGFLTVELFGPKQ